MKISKSPDEIRAVKDERIPRILDYPEEWQKDEWKLNPGKSYTVSNPVQMSGVSTFGKKPMDIIFLPQRENVPSFGVGTSEEDLVPATPDNLGNGLNNISVGKVGITEHILTLRQSTGLKVDCLLSENNFPSCNDSVFEFLKAIQPFLKEGEDENFVTVQEPLMVQFDNQGYCIFEPDEGEHKLIMDHQFSFPHIPSLGNQRLILEITPEIFAYFAAARPIAYGIRTKIAKTLIALNLKQVPYLNLNLENVLFADKNEFLNPKDMFQNGTQNLEAMLHEMIDKIALLGIIPGRFVGRVTTFFTDHGKDIEAGTIALENLKEES